MSHSKNFKHYVITRFNLKNKNWQVDKKNIAVLTDQWHDNRFKIFEDFCFTSLKNQSNSNFQWLVFFDESTKPQYRLIIERLVNEMPNFKPVFVDGMDQFLPNIISILAKTKEDYVITSRIDNDDCLSKNYVDVIQSNFREQDYMAFDFVDGYTIQIEPEVRVAKRLDQFNPFITLIEKNDNPKSVWNNRHSHWKRERNITQIKNKRIWASVIHQENKINGFGGYGHVDINTFFEDFKIAQNQIEHIKKEAIPLKQWKLLSLKNTYRSFSNYYYKNLKKGLGLYKLK